MMRFYFKGANTVCKFVLFLSLQINQYFEKIRDKLAQKWIPRMSLHSQIQTRLINDYITWTFANIHNFNPFHPSKPS